MGFLDNKNILIVGLASNRSIAYGIAKAMHREGATLAFTYLNDRFKDRVIKMANEFNSDITMPCDVTNDEQINNVFIELKKQWNNLDGLVHSVAFAPITELDGEYIDCATREGSKIAHDISSYSLVALSKAAKEMMSNNNASIIAMTYQGSERVIPNYNVMGVAKASLEANVRYLAASLGPHNIRVNAVSPGPIRTLAASGIKNFRKLLEENENITPLKRNTTLEEVGNVSAFLCSDLASGITGEIIHVDSGFHCVALTNN